MQPPRPHEPPRSAHWPAYRRAWLAAHNFCRACGLTDKLEVHHKKPFHLHPELELDPTNYITLCESATECHLKIGHLDDWHSFNPNVETDCKFTSPLKG